MDRRKRIKKDIAYWQKKYNEWWLNKLVTLNGSNEPKRVKEVKLYGPPSFVYGTVSLVFEDTTEMLIHLLPKIYKPRKQDVTVIKE